VLDALTAAEGGSFVRQDLVLDGADVPVAAALGSAAPFSTIYELNWSDVGRPGRHALGAIRHVVLVALAMLQATPAHASRLSAFAMAANRVVVEGALFWCAWPAVTTLLVRAAREPDGDDTLRLIAAIGVPCVLMAIAALHLGKYSRVARAGFVWVAVALGCGLGAAGSSGDTWIRNAAFVYALVQVVTVVVLGVATPIVVAASSSRAPVGWPSRIAAAALMYSPVVLVTMAGSLLWVVTLWLVPATALERWEGPFLAGLRYRLDVVEWWATVAVGGGIPILSVLAAAHYGVRLWRGSVAGEVVPGWLTAIMTITPFLLAFSSVHLLVGFFNNHAQQTPGDVEVLSVYQESVLRILPYLLGAIAPVRMLLDVLGDVVFHVVPKNSSLSILEQVTGRLDAILRHVTEPGVRVTVLAHSQGSIVALEAIRRGRYPVDLVTVGAPVHTLYKRFLGYAEPPADAFTWTNLWRTGDYIGGPVARDDVHDRDIGSGGHTGYWHHARVWEHLRSTPEAHVTRRSAS
jgi:hypothetical protein